MKKTFLCGALTCWALSGLWATGPQLKNEPTTGTPGETLPISQEATEQSVLPDEPALIEPTSEPASNSSNFQSLPTKAVPTGPSQDDLRKQAEAFRVAKTEAEEDFAVADIKTRAFAAPTEKEKRVLLREYYSAISARIIKKSPDLKIPTENWNFLRQYALSRPRTEPDNVPPVAPESFVAAMRLNAAKSKERKQQTGILPNLDGR